MERKWIASVNVIRTHQPATSGTDFNSYLNIWPLSIFKSILGFYLFMHLEVFMIEARPLLQY